ncbi:MAG: GNAT family N-acetyltransferase [Geminicoccaceae bacterium]
MNIQVIPVEDRFLEAWQGLYRGYAGFYAVPITDATLQTVWAWLHDEAHPLEGLLATDGEAILGLAHYRAMRRPLQGQEIGFLDDLFVRSDARGRRIGEALLKRVGAIARERGWSCVRWLTAEDNYRARTLYDRLAKKSRFKLYEIAVAGTEV